MGIGDKIEEIRNKPEHIRMRFVWFFVTASMVLVITIWILSLKGKRTETPVIENGIGISGAIEKFNESKDSVNKAVDEMNKAYEKYE